MELRVEQPADQSAVEDLHVAAFGAGHGATVVRLVGSLRAGEGALSLVAVDAGAVIGHVLFTRSLLDAPQRLVDVQVLSPLAVVPARQGEGVGSALVARGLQELAARGVPVVFLEGSPSYYGRLGFGPGAEQGFRRPSLRIPPAAFQAVRLPAHEPWMTGTLVYSAAFWEHDAVGLRD